MNEGVLASVPSKNLQNKRIQNLLITVNVTKVNANDRASCYNIQIYYFMYRFGNYRNGRGSKTILDSVPLAYSLDIECGIRETS